MGSTSVAVTFWDDDRHNYSEYSVNRTHEKHKVRRQNMFFLVSQRCLKNGQKWTQFLSVLNSGIQPHDRLSDVDLKTDFIATFMVEDNLPRDK